MLSSLCYVQEKDCSGFIPSHAMCKYGEFLFTQARNFLMLSCSSPPNLLVLLFNLYIWFACLILRSDLSRYAGSQFQFLTNLNEFYALCADISILLNHFWSIYRGVSSPWNALILNTLECVCHKCFQSSCCLVALFNQLLIRTLALFLGLSADMLKNFPVLQFPPNVFPFCTVSSLLLDILKIITT